MSAYGDWWADAACAQIGPADGYFFPDPGGNPEPAKRICRDHCMVREACLDAAMNEERGNSKHHRFGIRGGLTGRQRAALAKTQGGDVA